MQAILLRTRLEGQPPPRVASYPCSLRSSRGNAIFRHQEIAVNLNIDFGAHGDKIDTVLAATLLEGQRYSGTALRKFFGITRHRRARPS